jgi:signal transduction histidine kinase
VLARNDLASARLQLKEERRRLSALVSFIRDELGQQLAGIALLVEAARRSSEHSTEPLRGDLERVRLLLQRAIAQCGSNARDT